MSYFVFFKYKETIFSFHAAICSMMFVFFLDSILSRILYNQYGIQRNSVGFYMAIYPFAYAITAVTIGSALFNYLHTYSVICVGWIINILALLVMGPS